MRDKAKRTEIENSAERSSAIARLSIQNVTIMSRWGMSSWEMWGADQLAANDNGHRTHNGNRRPGDCPRSYNVLLNY